MTSGRWRKNTSGSLASPCGRKSFIVAGVIVVFVLYVLVGADPVTNQASAYIGEAENIRERLA